MWQKNWRLWSECFGGLWNELPATAVLANAAKTLFGAVVCEWYALIMPTPMLAMLLSAAHPSAASSISMIESARCGRGKRFVCVCLVSG
jgi:hypothetical protein